MADLGTLSYSLVLDKSKFEQDIQAARRSVLDQLKDIDISLSKLTINLSDAEKRKIQDALDQTRFSISKLNFENVSVPELQMQLNNIASQLTANVNLVAKTTTNDSGTKKELTDIDKLQERYDALIMKIAVLQRQKEELGSSNPIKADSFDTTIAQLEKVRQMYASVIASGDQKLANQTLGNQGLGSITKEYENYLNVLQKVQGEITKLQNLDAQGRLGDQGRQAMYSWMELLNKLNNFNASSPVSLTTVLSAVGREIKDLQQQTRQGIVNDAMAKKSADSIRKVEDALRRLQNQIQINDKKGLGTSELRKGVDELQRTLLSIRGLNLAGNFNAVVPAAEQAIRKAKEYADTQRVINTQQQSGKQAVDEFAKAVQRLNNETNKTKSLFNELKPIIGNAFSIYGIKQFWDELIQVGGEIQKQKMAMASILGDQGIADDLFDKMRGLAVKSPFGILDLIKSTKQLSAFGVEASELYDTMKRLSDISAGAGVEVGRLAYAFGQVKSRTWLDAKELRQISYTGIPMLAELTKYWNEKNDTDLTTADLRKMISQRQVSFEDMKAVLWKMTNDGGQFYNMQEVISESVAAKYKNMQDAIDLMMNDIAESNSEVLKAPAEFITKLTRNYDELVPLILAVVSAWGAQKAMLLVNNTLLGTHTGSVIKSALAYKQQTAQQILAMKGHKMSMAEQMKLMASTKALTSAELQSLVSNRMLTEAEVQRLVVMKKITPEQAIELAQMNGWSIAAMKAAASTGFWGRSLLVVGNAMRSLVVTMKSFLFNPATIAFAAVGGIAEIVQRITDFNRDMDNMQASALTKSQETAKNLASSVSEMKDTYDSIQAGNAPSKSALKESLKDLIELVKNYDPEWGKTLTNSLTPGKDVIQQWTELYDRIQFIQQAAEKNPQVAGISARANKATTFGLDDSLSENLKDLQDTYKEYYQQVTKIAKYPMYYKEGLDAAKSASVGFAKALEELEKKAAQANRQVTMREQMDELAKYGDAMDAFSKKSKDAMDDYASAVQILDATSLTLSIDKDRALSDMDTFFESIQAELETLGFDEMNAEQKKKVLFAVALDAKDFIEGIDGLDPIVKELFLNHETWRTMNIDFRTIFNGGDNPLLDWQKQLDEITSGKFRLLIASAATAQEAIDGIKKAYKESKEKVEQAQPIIVKFGIQWDGKTTLTGDAPSFFDSFGKDVWGEARENRAIMDAAEEAAKKWGFLLKETTKKTKGSGSTGSKGSQKDTYLEGVKNRIKALQTVYNEYKKWVDAVGKERANNALKESGLLDLLFGKGKGEIIADAETFKKKLGEIRAELQKQATSDARKSELEQLIAKILDIDLDEAKKAMKKLESENKAVMDRMSKQWDLYDVWYNATGSQDVAKRMMNNLTPIWTKEAEDFRKRFEDRGGILGKEAFFTMDDYAAKEMFKENQDLYDLWKKIHDLITDAGFQYSKNAAEAVKTTMTYADKVAKIEKEREDLLSVKGLSLNERNAINAQQDKKLLEIDPAYIQFFSAVTTMTKEKAQQMGDTIKNSLNTQLSSGAISIDEWSKSIEKVDSTLKSSSERIDTYLKAWLRGDLMSYYNNEYNNAKYKQGVATEAVYAAKKAYNDNPTEENRVALAKAMEKLIKANEDLEQALTNKKKQESKEEDYKTTNDVIGKAKELVGAFEFLSEAIQNMVGEISELGTISEVLNGGLNGATQGASFAQALGLSGPWGAAIGAGIGIMSSVFAQHDKALEKQIEQSKRNQELFKNISENTEKMLESTFGGIYSMDITADQESTLKAITSKFLGISSRYSANTLKSAKEALNERSYYDAQFALLQAQRDELKIQRESELDKKNTNWDAVADYEQSIKEVEMEIENFAKDMADALYGIDFKDWASKLSDAVVEAWSKGEDAAQAYKDTVQDIMKDVVKSFITQTIMEKALESVWNMFEEEFIANNGKLTENSIWNLSNALAKAGENATQTTTNLLDSLKSVGVDLSDTSSNASLGQSIQNITESQADLLASYLNAMRADLSIHKYNFETFLKDYIGEGSRTINAITEAQLTELQNIASYTSRTATAVESLDTKIQNVIDGNAKLNIQ